MRTFVYNCKLVWRAELKDWKKQETKRSEIHKFTYGFSVLAKSPGVRVHSGLAWENEEKML